jgi:uncharacterized protein YjbI with pentapeptide repeats
MADPKQSSPRTEQSAPRSEPSPPRCQHVFDPDERPQTNPDNYESITDDDGEWHCPHPAADGGYCHFHGDPTETDPETVADAFRHAVADEARPNEFLDAHLGGLDLAYVVVEGPTNRPIDLRATRVEADVNLDHATVEQRIRLDDARIEGKFRCRRATFDQILSSERATFADDVDFRDTQFDREVYLSAATITGRCQWFGATFSAGVFCNLTTFEELNAHVTEYGDTADFSETTVENAQFSRATFHGEVRFHDATFESASFAGIRCHDLAYFDRIAAPERLSFDAATFHDVLALEDLRPAESGTTVGLRNAEVATGRLYEPAEGDLVYDLRDATVGDIELGDDSSTVDLNRYRFLDTTFDGFDFGTHRDQLAAVDWRLDDTGDPLRTPSSEPDDFDPSPGDLESTFLKAKNGANQVGDTAAAAEFFRLEMLFRRRSHGQIVRHGGRSLSHRVVSVGRWIGNLLLSLTAGYGERPSRVVATAVATVAVFTVGFWALLGRPPHGHPLGYLVVSLESFLTLVLAGGAPISNPWIRLFALVEGFVGAFLVALFVFTLTRSIHR